MPSHLKPLSPKALDALAYLCGGPRPVQQFNPGLRDRFAREAPAVVELVEEASPYASHKGKPIPHYRLTSEGMATLRAAGRCNGC